MPFRFSLRALIIAVTVICMIAALIIYCQPRNYARFHAPLYAMDMMNATKAEWTFSGSDYGASYHVQYPHHHPEHHYVLRLGARTKKKKYFMMAFQQDGSISSSHPWGAYWAQKKIPEDELPDATIWVEIRIEDKFGNVLFHGVKESETYAKAFAKANQRGNAASQTTTSTEEPSP